MKTQTAVFIGRRITTANKLAYFWHFVGEERPRGWQHQLAPATIGECWSFTLTNEGGVFTSGEHKPAQLPARDASVSSITEWQATDIAHTQRLAQEKATRKLAARKTEFDRALEPLLSMYQTLRTRDDRHAFLSAVEKKLMWGS